MIRKLSSSLLALGFALLLSQDVLAQANNYPPPAQTTQLGLVKGDGTTFTIVNGVGTALAGGTAGFSQLTGAVTAGPGSGSQVATIAATGVTAASYGSSTSIPSFTVNAAGQLSAAAGNAVVAPAGTLTGATLAAGVTASSLTSVGTLASLTVTGTTTLTSLGGGGTLCVHASNTGVLSTAAADCGTGGGGGLTVGTSTITSGTTTRVLFDNAGVLGEYVISGTGNVAMTTNGVFTTPNLGTPSALVLTNATGTPSAITLTNGTGLPVAGITGLGTGVGTALGTAVSGSGAICLASGSACSGGATNLTVGTSTITSGTTTRVFFDNAGVLGEYVISGTGNVAMTTNGVFTTPNLGTPSALVLTNATGTPSAITLTNGTGLPVAGITGLGTGVGTALGVNVGSAGAFVTFNGAGGTPSSLTLTNATGLPLAGMANLAANSIIGNNTGSPATPIALTVAQVKTLIAMTTADVTGPTGGGTQCLQVNNAGAISGTGGACGAGAAASTGYTVAVSITRTADTNAYAANDIIGAATGSTAAQTFTSVAPSAQDVYVSSVELEIDDTAVISGETSYRLYLYSVTPPSALGDNAAWDLPSGDRASFLGYVDFGTPADIGSTLYVRQDNINTQIKLASANVFAYLVTNGAYTPSASRVYKITLHTVAL